MPLNFDSRHGPLLVYFSSVSENTRRFIGKVGLPSARIPLRRGDPPLAVRQPFVLVTPTYGGGASGRTVPRQVIHFLNDPANRQWIRGVITAGNTNFGAAYCAAGPIIARKCEVPELYRFELLGTRRDVDTVHDGLLHHWDRLCAGTPRPLPAVNKENP
ncbi:class Ib ribonucleoside-diphosphate reductase assembly flavoprotein NrdI [Corynebacterium glyciniphilum]|uniref:class Ib ribonucleoside-diphosphate reductase assembly flavoprotein NrdI n=1 Tax=Corynebacterium glyciniphilum TaxID=1404244 RepID=UPI0011AB5FC7|nr:class Ib ribonucleoside-diphosphate reductase assembly flavoprotein NrdI [Corynebacterium glyciniphilum]